MEYLSRVPEVKDTVDKQSLLSHLCAYVVDRFNDSTDLFSEIPAVSRAAKVQYTVSARVTWSSHLHGTRLRYWRDFSSRLPLTLWRPLLP